MSTTIPSLNGYVSTMANVGETSGWGIDLQINALPVKTKDFEWSSVLSWSLDRNKIEKLANGVTENINKNWFVGEEIGVYLIDENGNIGAIADDPANPANFSPIPIRSFFVGDKNLGGYEEPDSNSIRWGFLPNWSDNLVIVQQSEMDYNPLTDLTNVASNS